MTATSAPRAVLRQRLGDRLLDARGRLDVAAAQRLGRQARALTTFTLQLRDDLGQLFELPLVHDEVVLAQDALLERVQVRVLGEQLLELRAADALRSGWPPGRSCRPA